MNDFSYISAVDDNCFDPRRASILLIGGDKKGNDRFCEEYGPVADDLYDEHLEELREEGLIE